MVGYFGNVWSTLMANFGRKPSKPASSPVGKWIIFVCLLAGNILWITYRASLTSKLSVDKKELPFTSLNDLPDSGYRYIHKSWLEVKTVILSNKDLI